MLRSNTDRRPLLTDHNLLDADSARSHNAAMKNALLVMLISASLCAPGFAQQPASNAATKQDVEQLLTLTGVKERMHQMWAQMGQQMALTAAESFHLKNPDATPLQVRKVQQVVEKSFQNSVAVLSPDELINAVVPIYQKHLSHSDIQAIIAFYNTDAGKRFLKEQPAMQTESMQAVQPIIQKHLPEMQAAAEKAVQQTLHPYTKSSGGDASKSGK